MRGHSVKRHPQGQLILQKKAATPGIGNSVPKGVLSESRTKQRGITIGRGRGGVTLKMWREKEKSEREREKEKREGRPHRKAK